MTSWHWKFTRLDGPSRSLDAIVQLSVVDLQRGIGQLTDRVGRSWMGGPWVAVASDHCQWDFGCSVLSGEERGSL